MLSVRGDGVICCLVIQLYVDAFFLSQPCLKHCATELSSTISADDNEIENVPADWEALQCMTQLPFGVKKAMTPNSYNCRLGCKQFNSAKSVIFCHPEAVELGVLPLVKFTTMLHNE